MIERLLGAKYTRHDLANTKHAWGTQSRHFEHALWAHTRGKSRPDRTMFPRQTRASTKLAHCVTERLAGRVPAGSATSNLCCVCMP